MLSSKFLKDIMTEAYPIIQRQLEDAKVIASFRELVTANGGDWSALKALMKAHVEDSLDESGDGKRVRKILDKADSSNAYAEMLGLANMNEKNFIAGDDEHEEHGPDPIAALRANPNLAIVEAAALVKSTTKNSNTNSQRPSSANDLTGDVSSSLGAGQVPQIQPETLNELQDPASNATSEWPETVSRSGGLDGTVRSARTEANAVTAGETATNSPEQAIELTAEGNQPLRSGGAEAARLAHNQEVADASPAPATKPSSGVAADKTEGAPAPSAPRYAAPGVVTWESSPPEGVERSPYSMAFGIMGQDTAVIADDLEKGRAQPIVKMGRVIIDGWARYMAARDMRELDGSPVAYPVVQYDGQDSLIDVIKLNVDGRLLNEQQKRLIAATLARIEPKRKADIFKAFELFVEPV